VALVHEITFIVEDHNISDPFMGLILVPLVEKAAEHITAVDEAWDNQMNLALSHVLGATLQTALFNAPFIVIVGWGMNFDMGLDFDVFNLAMLILAIITVGNFLRDQKSNYLEGFLMIVVYVIIAIAAFYNPTLPEGHGAGGEATGEGSTSHARSVLGM
jgi:Ca2+:H+ antiporter